MSQYFLYYSTHSIFNPTHELTVSSGVQDNVEFYSLFWIFYVPMINK